MKNGFISFLMLFVLLFIFSTISAIWLYQKRSAEIWGLEGEALHLKNELDRKVWNKKNKVFSGRLAKQTMVIKQGQAELSREVLSFFSDYQKLNLLGNPLLVGDDVPVFNYANLFSKVTKCKFETDVIPDDLSAASLRSNRLCKLSLANFLTTRKVYQANLKAENIVFGGIGLAKTNLLAASGYIKAENLIISLPTLVVAGGDLKISNVKVLLNALPTLTLVSATGRVELKTCSENVKLFVISNLEPDLPVGIEMVRNLKIPNVLKWLPIKLSS